MDNLDIIEFLMCLHVLKKSSKETLIFIIINNINKAGIINGSQNYPNYERLEINEL